MSEFVKFKGLLTEEEREVTDLVMPVLLIAFASELGADNPDWKTFQERTIETINRQLVQEDLTSKHAREFSSGYTEQWITMALRLAKIYV